MNPDRKIDLSDWYMRIGWQVWIAASYKCINKLVDNPQTKMLCINISTAFGYNIVEKLTSGNSKLKKYERKNFLEKTILNNL